MAFAEFLPLQDSLTVDEFERLYPPRDLSDNAMVTRVGPSPTGYMHIGTLYTGLLCSKFAKQTGGKSFLRIEDTDKKREVPGAISFILDGFRRFGISFDEGPNNSKDDAERYGPYVQSERRHIYHAYIRHLLDNDAAYLCFCTSEELDDIRKQQTAKRLRTGYYGEWALWRDKPASEIKAALTAGKTPLVRLRSTGRHVEKFKFNDLIVGERLLPENDLDVVLMKSDGLPTYHFAHVVDDHLMRTTHVIRGDEWLSSVPVHLELFKALGWQAPSFAHIAPINKMDGNSKRKLSKRKDVEAGVSFFHERGYPPEVVLSYLLTIASSDFENWRSEHPDTPIERFQITFEKLRNSSGPLFDFDKLDSISREFFAKLNSDEVYNQALDWAQQFDSELHTLFLSDPAYCERILSVERGGQNSRKDLAKWSDLKEQILFYFDGMFELSKEEALELLSFISENELQVIVSDFFAKLDLEDSNDAWFEKLKAIANKNGFSTRAKDFKTNPEYYKGTIADFARIFRVLLTGQARSPDLFSVIQTMGLERVKLRLALVL
jgi:glutamyl-tRNA synthetase